MEHVALTFIGGGVLSTSIVDGLRDYGKTAAPLATCYDISITARREEHARALRQKYPKDWIITTNNRDPRLWKTPTPGEHQNGHSESNGTTPSKRIVFICTQPQYTSKVCEDIRCAMQLYSGISYPIIVTMCPGITIQQLETWLKQKTPIVRTMPNTPVGVRQGATAMFANSLVSGHEIKQVMDVYRPVSPALCLLPREDLLDVAAAFSGSAPAYFFTLMEMLVDAAVRRGIPEDMASALVKQSALGSAVLARSTDSSLHALRMNVCVPVAARRRRLIACIRGRWMRRSKSP